MTIKKESLMLRKFCSNCRVERDSASFVVVKVKGTIRSKCGVCVNKAKQLKDKQ
jgi:hypothetical protein